MAKQYIKTNSDGDKYYFKNPEMTIKHRTDGPAIEFSNGYKAWYANGVVHRVDGPAVEHAWGFKQWYVNDVFIFAVIKEDNNLLDRMK